MKKTIKYIGIGALIFVVGGLGGLLVDYVIFSKMVTHPVWSQNPIVKAFDSRVEVIKTIEKVVVQDNESIADIAGRAATTVVYVESVSAEGVMTSGNGAVIGSDGVIVTTAAIVPEVSKNIYIKLADNTVHDAELVFVDEYMDIVFLRIKAQDLATIPFANSDDARSGKRLISIMQSRIDNGVYFASGGLIGNAYAFSVAHPVSDHLQGVLKVDFSESVLASSVGAPVVDYHGNMVGLVSEKKSVGEVVQSEHYAVAANDIYKAFEAFLRAEHEEDVSVLGLLGVDYAIVSGIDVHSEELGVDSGALIDTPVTYQERIVFNNSLAGRSGLRGGDIVVTVNSDVVDAKNNLSRLMHKNAGKDVALKVLRGDSLITVDVVAQQ